MNASLHTIFSDLTRALETLTAQPLIADVFEWEREQSPRLYPNMAMAMELYGIAFSDTDSLSTVKDRLKREIFREKLKLEQKHWSFDASRLASYADMKAVIEKYEWDTCVAPVDDEGRL